MLPTYTIKNTVAESLNYKKVKLIYYLINMGSSEKAIADKVSKNIKQIAADKIECETITHFLFGEYLLNRKGAISFDLGILQDEYGVEIEPLSNATPYQSSDNNELVIKILFAQTAACGAHSSAKHSKTKNNDNNNNNNEEDFHFLKDFQFALETLKPDIVFAENLPTIPASSKVQIKDALAVYGSISHIHDMVIDHSNYTASERQRYYIIGTSFKLEDCDLKPEVKNRLPLQYLFTRNTNPKYQSLRDNMCDNSNRTLLRLPIRENDRKSFIRQLRIYFLLKNTEPTLHAHNLIILPKKALNLFPKINNEIRKDKMLENGLSAVFNPKKGRVTFYGLKKNGIGNFEKHQLLHTQQKTPTLFDRCIIFSFWDDDGYAPNIGELSLIQGMTKDHTYKMLDLLKKHTGKSVNTAVHALAHSLSPKVVSPFLINCILRKLKIEKILPIDLMIPRSESDNNNYQTQTGDTKVKCPQESLAEAINISDYEIINAKLHKQNNPDEFITVGVVRHKLTKTILCDEMIISPLPLIELYKQNYLSKENKEPVFSLDTTPSKRKRLNVHCGSEFIFSRDLNVAGENQDRSISHASRWQSDNNNLDQVIPDSHEEDIQSKSGYGNLGYSK